MKNKINDLQKLLLFICLWILLPSDILFGAPLVQDVSGETSDKGTLTITGTGFGMHDDYDSLNKYLNYLFEDCEAGVIDAAPKKWLGWASMTSDNNKLGSSYNVFHEKRTASIEYETAFGNTYTRNIRYNAYINVKDVAPVHNYFISEWIRLSDDFGNISANVRNQVKMLMTTPDGAGGKDYFQTRGEESPPLRTETENGLLSLKHGPIADYMPYGTWHRMDMWVSIPDATTGRVDKIKWWIDGKLIREAKQTDGKNQPSPEDVNNLIYISFIGYIDNTSDASFSLQTDDHFVDFTMARVEISDSPVWDDEVQIHKEIQLPISWTDSSIEIEANLSSFPAAAELYLYIVDSTGAVSAGFLLSGVGATPSTKPSSVQGFSVVK